MISWVATAATIIAACMTASNLGTRITGYGFAVFLLGSICWLAVGLMTGQSALLWTNAVLTLLNIFGIWRWLGRQATIEDGATAASMQSRDLPQETLFPASLLTRAPVAAADGTTLGHCIDAMAGCSSGRLRYLVVSEGGVGGVGETLRRLDWADARVDGDQVRCRLDAAAIGALEEITKDKWPAR